MLDKDALKGIKVVEFTWVLAGPWTTKVIGDCGGTVVRIESRKRPCLLRLSPPYKDGVPGLNRTGLWAAVNANKYSMTLDLNHPRAAEVLRKLIAWSDIVTETFTPGTAKRWGLDYEALCQIKEDVIFLQASIQGQTGPHSRQPGFGVLATALVGITGITGWPDRPPVLPFSGYTDTILPLFGAAALLGALDYRRRTGKGQHLDISQYEAALQFIAPLLLDYTVNGREAGRQGNTCSFAAPHGIYPCRGEDRWCAIAISTDEEWQAFCKATGELPWTKEERFRTLVNRKQHEEELNRLVSDWTQELTAEELMRRLQRAGVPAGVVESCEDMLKDPQLKFRDNFWWLEQKEVGAFPTFGEPFLLSETPARPRRPAPLIGEHTEYVCRELLGIPEKEYAELLAAKVFE